MAIINLRDYYPFYTQDEFVEVSDEVIVAIKDAENQERNYVRRAIYNNAQYSLDCGDGIEHSALFVSPSPSELCERKLEMEQLYEVLAVNGSLKMYKKGKEKMYKSGIRNRCFQTEYC